MKWLTDRTCLDWGTHFHSILNAGTMTMYFKLNIHILKILIDLQKAVLLKTEAPQ